MRYLFAFILSGALSTLLVGPVRNLAWRIGAIDAPAGGRKIHDKPMPRAGGIVLYLSFVIPAFIFTQSYTLPFWGLIVSTTMMLVLGLLDDMFNLNPWVKLGGQFAAALAAILCGIQIGVLSGINGRTIQLVAGMRTISIGAVTISFVSLALSLLWLVGITNTVNFLDGLDGLTAGVSAIAALVMFLLSLSAKVNQPATAMLSIILAGSCLGYLWHNFYPAKIFNGDSGAYFLGMTIGVLSIISGAKLATALLVMGLPILDACWAVVRRLATGRSPFSADRGHIHHLLLDAGLNQRQAVLVIYAFSIAFGTVALLSGTRTKAIAMVVMIALTTALLSILHIRYGVRVRAARRQTD